MPFTDEVTTLPADDITPGTLTGSIVQTATTGQRVVLTTADADGLPAVEFYSGQARETAPGEVSARVDATLGRPYVQMDAPSTAADVSTSAYVRAYSGDQTGIGGLWEITTGDGNSFSTYVTGSAADSTSQGDITLHVDDSADSYSELVVSADLVQFLATDGLKGFTYDSSGTTDELSVTGDITLGGHLVPLITGTRETWHTPTYNSGWVSGASSGSYQPFQYRQDGMDNLVPRGAFHASSAQGSGATVFTLPSQYRPKAAYLIPLISTSGTGVLLNVAAALQVNPTGNVVILCSGSIGSGQTFFAGPHMPLGNIP